MAEESFSVQLREEAQAIWDAIFAHPFLEAVQAGTLPLEQFSAYLCQDYRYLEGFARAVALALAKAPDPYSLRLLSQRVLRPVERSLHTHLFDLLELDLDQVEETPPAPTNLAYINHMLASAALGGVGEAAAALLPCPWTYHELGNHLPPVSSSEEMPPVYREWLGFYHQGALTDSVAAWRELVDIAAAGAGPSQREAMRRAFLTSCRYEYLFWEMAWRQEAWPLEG